MTNALLLRGILFVLVTSHNDAITPFACAQAICLRADSQGVGKPVDPAWLPGVLFALGDGPAQGFATATRRFSIWKGFVQTGPCLSGTISVLLPVANRNGMPRPANRSANSYGERARRLMASTPAPIGGAPSSASTAALSEGNGPTSRSPAAMNQTVLPSDRVRRRHLGSGVMAEDRDESLNLAVELAYDVSRTPVPPVWHEQAARRSWPERASGASLWFDASMGLGSALSVGYPTCRRKFAVKPSHFSVIHEPIKSQIIVLKKFYGAVRED